MTEEFPRIDPGTSSVQADCEVNLNLKDLTKIHSSLEYMCFVTQPNLLLKVNLHNKEKIWRRAVARATTNYLIDVAESIGPLRNIIAATRQMNVTKQLENPLAQAVFLVIAARALGISTTDMLIGLALVGKNSASSAAVALGFSAGLPGAWSNPRRAMDESHPEVLTSADRRIDGATTTFLERMATIIAVAAIAEGTVGFAALSAKGGMRGLIAASARTIINTETAQVSNDVRGEVFENNGVKVRRWVTVQGTSAASISPVDAVCLRNAAAGWIPMGQPYPSGHMRPTAHPNCRCHEEARISDADLPDELEI